MTEALVVFRKIFTLQFYRLNAGFFLLIITLCFGFMSGREHKALAQFFVSSPSLTLIPVAVWVVYLLKVTNFNVSRLALPENSVVHHLNLMSAQSKQFILGSTLISQFAPAIAYGAFVAVMALRYNRLIELSIIVVSQVLLVAAGTIFWQQTLRRPQHEIRVWTIKSWVDKNFSKPMAAIHLTWLLRREPVLAIATKIFSGAILFAVTQLYKTDVYDWRLLSMGILLAGSSNFMIANQLQSFEIQFPLLRNMPIAIARRCSVLTSVISMILIPEFAVLTKNFPVNLTTTDLFTAGLLLLCTVMYFYALNYLSIPQDKMSRWILGSFIAGVVLTLFGLPMGLLAFAVFSLSIAIMSVNYYDYEGRNHV